MQVKPGRLTLTDTCKKINIIEMWMYRKMLKISYTSHTTNEGVLKRVNEEGMSLENNIKMRKTQCFGHLVRKDKMQKYCWKEKYVRKDQGNVPVNRG